MEKWFNVGKIVNTHGIKGEVRVISRTDFTDERYHEGNSLYIFTEDQSEPVEVKVIGHRMHKQFDLLQFEGYPTVNDVEKFKGSLIKVPESQLGELEEDEYYFHEIIGCTVYSLEGDEIGKVIEIINTGANDVWVVKRKQGKDVLIPYIVDIVKEIDVQSKKISIELMEGLIE